MNKINAFSTKHLAEQSMIHFFFALIKKFKLRIGFIIAYSSFCGYIFPYWTIFIQKSDITKYQLLLIGIAMIHFSFIYIKELLLFPIYNYATYLINIKNLETAIYHNKNAGLAISRAQRASSIKLFARYFLMLWKNLSTIITTLALIYKTNHKLGNYLIALTTLYFALLYFTQKICNKMRAQAWGSTERAGISNAKTISDAIAIVQNFFSYDDAQKNLEQEYFLWNRYYFLSNVFFSALVIISSGLLIAGFAIRATQLLFIWTLLHNIKNFTNNTKMTSATIVDLKIFFEKHNKKKSLIQKLDHPGIKAENVLINNLGPFEFDINFNNFEKSKNIIALIGENGVGKTTLSMTLANLLPFSGNLYNSFSTLYLNSSLILNSHDSAGQNAFKITQQALKHQAQLIIFDESLDNIDEKSLKILFSEFKISNKLILIISHNQQIIDNCDYKFTLHNNHAIKQITIK